MKKKESKKKEEKEQRRQKREKERLERETVVDIEQREKEAQKKYRTRNETLFFLSFLLVLHLSICFPMT